MDPITTQLSDNADILTIAALVLGGLAFLIAVFVMARQRAVLRPFAQIKGTARSPEEILPAVLRLVEEYQENLNAIASALNKQIEDGRASIQKVSIVRYDAFEDIGGQQSYSLCLLDGTGNGLLLTYLTGRNSTRSYAVPVSGGQAARKLSEEETRALELAMSGQTAEAAV